MADTTFIPTPSMDGLFGGGGGGGLIGGLILGSLLRNNGNIFGGDGSGAAAAAALNPTQNQANMSLMAGLGDIKQAVAVNSANMETSQALQSSTIQNQLSQVAGALTNTVNGVKDTIVSGDMTLMNAINGVKDVTNANGIALMNMINGVEKSNTAASTAILGQISNLDKTVMSAQNAVQQSITADGDKTRALLINQYEATLNRQLQEANAALVELRSQQNLASAARGIEVNTTNNINQAQAQQQQQAQFAALAGLVGNLANDLQYIRATNQAINIGGTQTANPANTNTQIR